MLGRVWSHRDLVVVLAQRQFQLRYRQSFIGFFGALLPPLAALGVGTLVFQKVAGVETGESSYQIFALAALAPWTFFANGLVTAGASVQQGIFMVTRLAFPRAALPLSAIGTALIDLVIAFVLFIVVVYVVGPGLPVTAGWTPLLLLIEVVLLAGLSLLFSALGVFAWDLKLALPMLVNMWLLLTPVLYPLADVPESVRGIYLANPMTGLIESFRRVLVFGQSPEPSLLVPAIVGAVGSLIVGVWYFGSTEKRFADVI